MTKITYSNTLGEVVFGKSPIKILKTDGLTLPEKQFSTFLYSDGSGQATVGEATLPRYITVTADIYLKNGTEDLSKMLRILNEKGILIIESNAKIRKIKAYLNSFKLNEKYGKYRTFTLQFVCDYPYFSDYSDHITGLFNRENLVADTFTLPCIFTKRNSGANIILDGEFPSEPVIKIYCIKEYEGNGGGITVVNHRNSNFFKLNYSLENGEEITVDFHNRTITDALGNSLINHISEDTFLSEFKLEVGENPIEILNGEDAEAVSCYIEYNNIYAEAVL